MRRADFEKSDAAVKKTMEQIKQDSTSKSNAGDKMARHRGLYMDFMGPSIRTRPPKKKEVVRPATVALSPKLAPVMRPKKLVRPPIVTTTRHIKEVTTSNGNRMAVVRDVSVEHVSREIVREKIPNLVGAKPKIAAKAPNIAKAVVKSEVASPVARAKNEVPDANNYSLGGKSPFITDAKIAKRPLGKSIPDGSAYEIRSSKNIYSQRSFIDKEVSNVNKSPVIISMERKRSGWLWTILTLLVIAVGAGIGVLLYLYFAA